MLKVFLPSIVKSEKMQDLLNIFVNGKEQVLISFVLIFCMLPTLYVSF